MVLGLATSASASPDSHDAEERLGDAQLELLPRRDLLADPVPGEKPDPYYRGVAFAQLTGGGRGGGDAGAGAAAALTGAGCDLLAGTAQGRFRPFDVGGVASGEATYSVCLSEVLLTARFDGSRGFGVLPGLDARRSLWSRSYDATYDRMKLAGGEVWSGPHRHTVLSLAIGHGTTTQQDGLETRTIKQLDMEFALYRYRHTEGLTLQVLSFDVDAMKAGVDNRGGVASSFMPLQLRYDSPGMFVSARGGWGWTGGQVSASGSMSASVNGTTIAESSWTEHIDGEGLPKLNAYVGDVEAGVHRGRLQMTAKASRIIYPTFDGDIAREARVAGALTYVTGGARKTEVTLSPFAARTHTWTRDSGDSRDISAGAALHVGRPLADRVAGAGFQQLRVDAIAEAGVSPYARLDGDRLPSSTLAGQVVVALSGRVTQ